jgi:hypothetical protein
MSNVKRKILVLSGKGGVGKSTFTAQLGWAFAADDALQVSSVWSYVIYRPLSAKTRLESWTLTYVVHLFLPSLELRMSKSTPHLLVGPLYMSRTIWQSCQLASCYRLRETQLCGEGLRKMA